MSVFKTITHNVDLCVVGGGLAGMSVAIAAARKGVRVALMHDRPVLGGNASSEIRMWVCGAHGDNNRETGIIEEIILESYYRNPTKNYSIWDGILYEKVRFEPNIELILNCSCLDCTMDGDRVADVTGWQLTTQSYHKVIAKIFADCSGDSVLAPLTGALYTHGREASAVYGEDIAPQIADKHTMGMTCLIQGRETDTPVEYIPPAWAEKYNKDNLPENRRPNLLGSKNENFWYMELGGMGDSIADTEDMRDELLAVAFGMWDYVKNSGECGDTSRWELDWVGFLPGKRESRRYIGDYVMNQNDVRAEGRFEDLAAYGGWSMDDHHPAGFRTAEPPTIFHPAPSPFGIPYRSMYSKNIENLMFAGRNISLTHAALSATRVMATCATIGQAVGAAAYIALREGATPRGVYENHLIELKQTLMRDDCYLPFNTYSFGELSKNARLSSDCPRYENVRNGINRDINGVDNGWRGVKGSYIEYGFDGAVQVNEIRITFDSDLNRASIAGKDGERNRPMRSNRYLDSVPARVPETLVRSFEIIAINGGAETIVASVCNNYQRLVVIPCDFTAQSVRLVTKDTWGSPDCHVYSFEII